MEPQFWRVFWSACCPEKFTIRIRAEPQVDASDQEEENESYKQRLKERRVGYSGHREVTLPKAQLLKECVSHQTLLIEGVLKREVVDVVIVRNGEND